MDKKGSKNNANLTSDPMSRERKISFINAFSESAAIENVELTIVNKIDNKRIRKPSLVGLSYSEGNLIEYEVKNGDTLNGIAASHYVTVSELCHINRIYATTFLFSGQKLHVPKKELDPFPAKITTATSGRNNSTSDDEALCQGIIQEIFQSEFHPTQKRTRKLNSFVVPSTVNVEFKMEDAAKDGDKLQESTNCTEVSTDNFSSETRKIIDVKDDDNTSNQTTKFKKSPLGNVFKRQRSISTVISPISPIMENFNLENENINNINIQPYESKNQETKYLKNTRNRSVSTAVSPVADKLKIPRPENKKLRKTSLFEILSRQDLNKSEGFLTLRKPQLPFILSVLYPNEFTEPKKGLLEIIASSFMFESDAAPSKEMYCYLHVAFREVTSIEAHNDVINDTKYFDKDSCATLVIKGDFENRTEYMFYLHANKFVELNDYLTTYYPQFYIKDCDTPYKPLIEYKMTIKLREAQNVKGETIDDPINAYVTFKINGRPVHKSRIVSTTSNPRWEESFDLDLVTSDDVLRIKAKLAEIIRSKCLGSVNLNVCDLKTEEWTKLKLEFNINSLEEDNQTNEEMMHLFLEYKLTQKVDKIQDVLPFVPDFKNNSEIFTDSHIKKLCENLSNDLSAATAWQLAYSTTRHGSSIHTMYRNMNDLEGDLPLILAVLDSSGTVFGAFLSSKLIVAERYYGNGKCFLFSFSPKFQKFEWSSENSYFIKGNDLSFSIGSGGDGFGLWFDDNFIRGSTDSCETFSNTPLTQPKDFLVQLLEMWTPDFNI